MSHFSRLPEIGSSSGRPFTETLFVSPDGGATDGRTWAGAYTTIQDALDAASTDANDCTLINIAPHATQYDINTTGDPTWTGNYELRGTHRIWAAIKNAHADATCVFKFTGKVSLDNLAIFTLADECGVVFTGNGWRVRRCGFNSTGIDTAQTSVYIDGSGGTTRGGIMDDVEFLGHVDRTTAIHVEQSTINHFHHVNIHTSLVGVLIEHADSLRNYFTNMDVGSCALGFDIDAGGHNHFDDVNFHENTRNIDDETGVNHYSNLHGEFNIAITPDDFVGIAVATGGANAYGNDTELIAAAAIDNPFRIVGANFLPDAVPAEWYMVRFTADAGAPYYDTIMFQGVKREGSAAPSGTEHIFNAGTRISCSAKTLSGNDGVDVWLEVQEV